jgi:serine/threonine protein kinase/predicted ATPase
VEQFGKYQILRRLGAGGMAEVFLAREPLAGGLSKTLVIKKIHSSLGEAPQFRAMFEDEAKIGVLLNHPNIVQTFSYGQLAHTYFLAMERVEGIDLLRLIHAAAAAGRKVPPGLSAYVGQQVAKGLDYAHRKTDDYGEQLGIVHRDVSPQNILVSFDGSVKIVDFGIARARGQKNDEGVVKGKFAYMSPEQAMGLPVDRRSDIFSTGIVLYELTTGLALYGRMTERQALESIKNAIVPSMRESDPEIPEELERIVRQALAKRPEDRFQTARDLHNALGRFFFNLGTQEGTIFESGTLAQFIAGVVSTQERNRILSLDGGERPDASRRGPVTAVPEDLGAAALAPSAPSTAITEEPVEEPPLTTGQRERKNVVVVEGVLSGLPALRRQLGEGRAREVLLDFLRVAEHVAYKHHAHAARLDDRGFTYLVGMPVATEGDPSTAVHLAVALIEALDGISRDLRPQLTLALGVERGVALVSRSTSPGDARFDYELTGPVEKIAGRLAGEALAGEVLVGGAVQRAARGEWRFEELEPIDVAPEGEEGEATRTRVHRLLGPLPRAERMAQVGGQLFGRELELKALEEAAHDVVARGFGRYLLVVGDRGVGKRALVAHFRARLDADTHLVLRTVGSAARRDSPYALVGDLARDLLSIPDDAEPRDLKRRIDSAIGGLFGPENARDAKTVIDSIGMLLGLQVRGADELDPGERRFRLYQAVRLVGSRLARARTLVVLIEDLHFADAESLDLFLALARDPFTRPVLILATVQRDHVDEHDEKRLENLLNEPNVTPIFVGELGPRARESLMDAQFEAPDDAAVKTLINAALDRAGGNPFHLHEILEALAERGILEKGASGRYRLLEPGAEVALPVSVEAAVASRLEKLPAAERVVLRAAAVLGRKFRPSDVAAMTGDTSAPEIVEQLAARGLVDVGSEISSATTLVSGVAGGPRDRPYEFRNAVTQEVAYSGLAPEVKIGLHRAAASRLASAARYRKGADDSIIAQHLAAAGDTVGAARAYARAGAHARDVSGNAEAWRHFTEALDLFTSASGKSDETQMQAERWDLHAEREQILRAWGKRSAQLREISAMRKLAEQLSDGRRQAASHARLSSLYLDAGKHAAARREIARTLELARTVGAVTIAAEALRLDATLLMNIGSYDEALERTQSALAALGDLQERAPLLERAQTLNAVGNIQFDQGRGRDAERAYAEALVIYRRLGIRRLEAATLNNLGNVSLNLGEYEEAIRHYKHSLRIGQEIGDRVGIGATLGNVGQTYAMIGDLDRARRYLGKAIALDESSGDMNGLTDAQIGLGQVYLKQRDVESAAPALERGLELAQTARSRYQEIRALAALAFCRLDAGQPAAEALDLARSSVKLARQANVSGLLALGLCAEALALDRAGEPANAFARSAEALAIVDAGRNIDEVEVLLHIHARMALAAGRADEGRVILRRAVAEVRSRAERLRDDHWRALYFASHPACEILEDARSEGID